MRGAQITKSRFGKYEYYPVLHIIPTYALYTAYHYCNQNCPVTSMSDSVMSKIKEILCIIAFHVHERIVHGALSGSRELPGSRSESTGRSSTCCAQWGASGPARREWHHSLSPYRNQHCSAGGKVRYTNTFCCNVMEDKYD